LEVSALFSQAHIERLEIEVQKFQVYFDGGVRPFPDGGFAKCYGWVIKANGMTVANGNGIDFSDKDVGSCEVEFEALARALSDLPKHCGAIGEFEVHDDSRAVIDLCTGQAAPQTEKVTFDRARIANLVGKLKDVRFVWIPRKLNAEADKLGRAAFSSASRHDERIELMSKLSISAHRRFGSFYDAEVMAKWCERFTGKVKLANMSVRDLHVLLKNLKGIPNFVREYIDERNTAARTASVCF